MVYRDRFRFNSYKTYFSIAVSKIFEFPNVTTNAFKADEAPIHGICKK